MAARYLTLVLLLLAAWTDVVTAVDNHAPDLSHFQRNSKREPSVLRNPLISARQVKADTIRRGSKTARSPTKVRRQDCPTPQVSGGCCPPGQYVCTDTTPPACVDFTSDPANCGSCGNVCSSGSCCNSQCVDTTSDINNCGGCGQSCDITESCSTSTCVSCGEGNIYCDGSCQYAGYDSTCGSCQGCPANSECGSSTPGTGPWDTDYTCSCMNEEYTMCSNQCVTLVDDPNNCGSCGASCGSGIGCAFFSCCTVETPDSCYDQCTNTLTDIYNCGSCGNECGFDDTCIGGGCTKVVPT